MYSDAEYQTPEEQIKNLKERGLEFMDEAEAVQLLPYIGYQRLNSYLASFEYLDENHNRTCSGVRFEDVMRVYRFDIQLRSLMLSGLEGIEVAVRSMWADELSKKYGIHAYLDANVFKDAATHQRSLKKLLKTISSATYSNPDIRHWVIAHPGTTTLPFGIVVSIMSFGELLRWVRNTRCNVTRHRMSLLLGVPNVRLMNGVLRSLVEVRNLCAHHSRLWDRHISTPLPLIRNGLKRPLRSFKRADAVMADRRLYNYILMLSHLTQRLTPDRAWTARMITLLSEVPRKQLRIMGFPDDVSYTDI